MTANTILETVTGLRAKLHSLVILAAALTHQVAAARETLKQTEDNIINEIWSDEQYKNDRARNEQKRLARVNDERYIKAAEAVTAKEIDRARNNADILAVQNELAVATAQYQAALIPDHISGVQFQLRMVQVHGADVTSMEVKPEVAMPDPATAAEAVGGDLPAMAADVLQAYVHDTDNDLPALAEVDRKICDIVRSGETRFLDGAALQRVRDLYGTIKPVTGDKVDTTAPVEDQPAATGEGRVPELAEIFQDSKKDDDPAKGQAPYLKDTGKEKKSEKVGGVRI